MRYISTSGCVHYSNSSQSLLLLITIIRSIQLCFINLTQKTRHRICKSTYFTYNITPRPDALGTAAPNGLSACGEKQMGAPVEHRVPVWGREELSVTKWGSFREVLFRPVPLHLRRIPSKKWGNTQTCFCVFLMAPVKRFVAAVGEFYMIMTHT